MKEAQQELRVRNKGRVVAVMSVNSGRSPEQTNLEKDG